LDDCIKTVLINTTLNSQIIYYLSHNNVFSDHNYLITLTIKQLSNYPDNNSMKRV